MADIQPKSLSGVWKVNFYHSGLRDPAYSPFVCLWRRVGFIVAGFRIYGMETEPLLETGLLHYAPYLGSSPKLLLTEEQGPSPRTSELRNSGILL